ncbi:MAG: cupin domain-containing protein, partial [Candidatus Saccharimonadales bacterium]
YAPGGHSTDERRPMRHEGREYGVILSGTLTANVGFDSYELGPGDSIAFDSATPHEYLNKTDDYVHAIWVVVHPRLAEQVTCHSKASPSGADVAGAHAASAVAVCPWPGRQLLSTG